MIANVFETSRMKVIIIYLWNKNISTVWAFLALFCCANK